MNFGLSPVRAAGLLLRSAHLAAMALVLGGIALGAGRAQLKGAIAVTLATGILLLLLDVWQDPRCLVQGSGVAVLLKLALLGVGNLVPEQRFGWYLAATLVASLGAHMPGRWRHYDLIRGRVEEPGRGTRRQGADTCQG